MSESFFFVPRPNTIVGSGNVSASLPTNVVVQVQVRLYKSLSSDEKLEVIISCFCDIFSCCHHINKK